MNQTPRKNPFLRFAAKHDFANRKIKPIVGDLFSLYFHDCILHLGYGCNYIPNRDEDYAFIGQVLAKL